MAVPTILSSGPTSITIDVPQIHWASTGAEIITCLVLLVILWRYGSKWDHRLHLLLALFIGFALTATNAGAVALTHIHSWTHGLFG